MGYIFGAPGLPKTPEELARLRRITDAMAVRPISAPHNIGEGLNAIGQALMYRGMMDDYKNAAANLAKQQASIWSGLPGFGGGAGAATPGAPAPAPSSAPSAPMPISPMVSDTAAAATSGVPLADQPAPLSGGMPPQAAPQSAPSADTSDRQKYAFNYFVNKGYSPVQSAGIVGGLDGETANLNTTQRHDGGIGLGISGWNGDRLRNLYSFAQATGRSPTDLNTQLDFVDHELHSSEGKAFAALQGATTPAQAGQAMLAYFRPAGYDQPGAHPERARLAAEVFSRFGQQAQPGAFTRAGDALASLLGPASANAEPLTPTSALMPGDGPVPNQNVPLPMARPDAAPATFDQRFGAMQPPTMAATPSPVQVASLGGGAPAAAPVNPRQQILDALAQARQFTPGALPDVTNVPTRTLDLAPGGARDAVARALMGQGGASSAPAAPAPSQAAPAPAQSDAQRQQLEWARRVLQNPAASKTQQALAGAILKQSMTPNKPTNEIINYEYGLKHPDFAKANIEGRGKYGLSPVYGTDQQGNPVVIQLGRNGQPNIVKLPSGVTVSTGVEKVDLGTQWGMLDKRSGQIVGYMPKDLYGAAEQRAAGAKVGGTQGEATGKYQELKSNLPMLAQTVNHLHDLGQKATYTMAGQAYNWAHRELGLGATPGDVARTEYGSYVRDTVLPILKATFGAQMTVIEGEKLESTLGDVNLSPEQKDAALKAFVTTKVREINARARQSGQPLIPEPDFSFGQTGETAAPSPASQTGLPAGWSVKVH